MMKTGDFFQLCIAGTHSGVGKTTLTLGVLASLKRRGYVVQPFKCGPDYIDPGHHTRVSGRQSRNLDTWMMGRSAVMESYAGACRGVDGAVVEGVMGLFDGASSTGLVGSSAEVAKILGLPVILVVNARSMARSLAALVQGFATFEPGVHIAGVIANQVGSEKHARILEEALGAKEAILATLKDQLRLKTNLGYRLEVHPYGSLPRYEVKARRFKDLRKKEH
jgi:cobyrinic acid a,c-diamide synthase